MISDEDFEAVSRFRWHAHIGKNTVYAHRSINLGAGKFAKQLMHRFIMGATEPKDQVDHRDCDGLNNTRENLRFATQSQNNINQRVRVDNRTGHKGVNWNKQSQKFIARFSAGGNRVCLGSFDCPDEAARHYNRVAFDNGGGFEVLNTVYPIFPLTLNVKQE